MTNLKEILQKINRGDGSVGKLVNDQEFYKNAKLILQKLDKATEGLEDQGPLSVLGIVGGKLFCSMPHTKLHIPGPVEVSERSFRAFCSQMIGRGGQGLKDLY